MMTTKSMGGGLQQQELRVLPKCLLQNALRLEAFYMFSTLYTKTTLQKAIESSDRSTQ